MDFKKQEKNSEGIITQSIYSIWFQENIKQMGLILKKRSSWLLKNTLKKVDFSPVVTES